MSLTFPNKNKKLKRLTAEETIILIRLVKKYRLLWDATHPDFRSRDVCDHLYEKIGKYFHLTGEDVRKKFRRLRSSYRQELKQLLDGQKAYSNMFYFEEMEFLKDQIENRRRLQNKSSSDDSKGFPMEFHDTFSEIPSKMGSSEDMIEERLEEEEEVIEAHSGSEEDAIGFSKVNSDEVDAFAGFLASQLRDMDKVSALETMEELHKVISRRRIEFLNRKLNI